MVRNLAAQAEAIWPQEQRLFDRYHFPLGATCSTPVAAPAKFGAARADVATRACTGHRHHRQHLAIASAEARLWATACASRIEASSISGCLTAIRSRRMPAVLQAIPHADRAIAELVRVTRRGGWLHLIPEDYLMIISSGGHSIRTISGARARVDSEAQRAPTCASARTPTASCAGSGSRTSSRLRRRRSAARATRDLRRNLEGVARRIRRRGVTHTSISRERFLAHFEDMIATLDDPDGYGVWHVPVIAGQVP